MRTFGVFCKHPQPGEVKTRLAEYIGAHDCVQLSAAFVEDLTLQFRMVGERRVLGFSPADSALYFGKFSKIGYDLWPQPQGDLGDRIKAFFGETLQDETDTSVLIGSDSPTIPREYVTQAFDRLQEFDCILGPAMDGGYYLVGLRRPVPELFEQISWSGANVLSQTVQRIAEMGLSLALLPPWYDVDDLHDLRMLAGHIRAMTQSGQTHPCPITAEVLRKIQIPARTC